MKKLLTLASTITLFACGGPYTLSSAEKMTADNGALTYFASNDGKFTSCSPSDSDKDGYVTCEGMDKEEKPLALLCAYKATQSGCKRK